VNLQGKGAECNTLSDHVQSSLGNDRNAFVSKDKSKGSVNSPSSFILWALACCSELLLVELGIGIGLAVLLRIVEALLVAVLISLAVFGAAM